jgi:hypothetical protein
LRAVWIWRLHNYGTLDYRTKPAAPDSGATLIVLGVQGVFSSFFMSALGLKTATRKPPEPQN